MAIGFTEAQDVRKNENRVALRPFLQLAPFPYPGEQYIADVTPAKGANRGRKGWRASNHVAWYGSADATATYRFIEQVGMVD